MTIVEAMDSEKREMNTIAMTAMTIINPRKEFWPCRGSSKLPDASPVRNQLIYGARPNRTVAMTIIKELTEPGDRTSDPCPQILYTTD